VLRMARLTALACLADVMRRVVDWTLEQGNVGLGDGLRPGVDNES